MLRNEVPTPQKTKSFSFKKAKQLILFTEQLRVNVYIINTHCETEMHSFLTFKVSGTHR